MEWHRKLLSFATPISILLCAVFAARVSSNLLAQYGLADSNTATHQHSSKLEASPPVASHSKDASALRANNMFCRACKGEMLEPVQVEQGRRTALPLRLIATNLSEMRSYSFATVLNTQTQRQGAYQLGELIPEGGTVERIGHDFIEFAHYQDQRVDRIDFGSGQLQTVALAKAEGSTSSEASFTEQYLRVVDESHFEIDRKLIENIRSNPRLAGALARPVSKDGRMHGVRLLAVQPAGLAKAMGLQSGDTLVAANGVKLDSLEAGLELLGQLQQKDHWSFDIERAGKALQIQVDLR